VNTNKKEEIIKIEDDTNITIFINILFMGRTGAGKSTLINILLGEKKSLEGGNGVSTTSKNIIVYKKSGVPIRLYDVKGVEDVETLENYAKILTIFNGKKNKSNDSINAIFYCIEYKNGTIIEKMEKKLFEKLINFDIQIIFIITKTPYDARKKHKNKKTEKAREMERNRIQNTIKCMIKNLFKNEKEGEEFLKNYVHFYFVNLVRNDSLDVPVFGIDEVLSFFTKTVAEEDWKELENLVLKEMNQNVRNIVKKTPF
jgi:GTPase Era involved in 16S rRNA processing